LRSPRPERGPIAGLRIANCLDDKGNTGDMRTKPVRGTPCLTLLAFLSARWLCTAVHEVIIVKKLTDSLVAYITYVLRILLLARDVPFW